MKNVTGIAIDGRRIPNFVNLSLKETINDHGRFRVDVDIATLEERGAHTLDTSKELLGKIIVISFGVESDIEFLGIITKMSLKNKEGHEGIISLEGYSSTIKLDSLPANKSWTDAPLQYILKHFMDTYKVNAVLKPKYKDFLSYTTQYEETNWNFIQRLARTFGEPLEYDGVYLHFGRRDYEEPTVLEYGSQLSNINVTTEIRPVNPTSYTYDPTIDVKHESRPNNNVEGLNELSHTAFQESLSFYKSTAYHPTDALTISKKDIENYMGHKQASMAAKLHIIHVDCSVQGLRLGSYIKIKSAKNLGNWNGYDIKSYGEYRVIDIQHQATGEGTYSCTIQLIPSGIVVLPEPEVKLPKCDAQIAEVIDNEDPKGMGRVKVRMQWQNHRESTNWIRVLMTDAGASKHHAQNRGHVFIPEVGDQVMLGFEKRDPQRPFVLGALFTGTTGAGGGTNNNIKSITTKSGHQVVFDDTPNKESITVQDVKGNSLHIDTSGETITINALKDINIIAGENINISAGKNITVQAGENIDENAGRNKRTSIGKHNIITVGADHKLVASNIYEMADGNYEGTAENITKSAENKMTFRATENLTDHAIGKLNSNSNDNTNFS